MSQDKHDELIADGKLREDGSRVETCPTCGQAIPEGTTLAELVAGPGDAVAQAETVVVDSPSQEG